MTTLCPLGTTKVRKLVRSADEGRQDLLLHPGAAGEHSQEADEGSRVRPAASGNDAGRSSPHQKNAGADHPSPHCRAGQTTPNAVGDEGP